MGAEQGAGLVSAPCSILWGRRAAVSGVSAGAEVLALKPAWSAGVTQAPKGAGAILVQFDLDALPSGDRWVITEALMDWPISGLDSESRYEVSARAVSVPWSGEEAAPWEALRFAAEPVAEWDIEPLDQERNGGGFVRLDLRDLVAQWAANPAVNHGILIQFRAVESEFLARQLENAVLTIRSIPQGD